MKRGNSLIMAMLLLISTSVLAGDVYVISNKGVSLAAGDVRDVFGGDKQLAGSVKLVPVDNAAVQKDFLDKVMKVDAAKYNSVWVKKGFREGLSPPAVKGSDAEVISFVKATPGAVGYVAAPADGVSVVQKF
jgi:hypothetical protein